jgi:hypothetical protein
MNFAAITQGDNNTRPVFGKSGKEQASIAIFLSFHDLFRWEGSLQEGDDHIGNLSMNGVSIGTLTILADDAFGSS